MLSGPCSETAGEMCGMTSVDQSIITPGTMRRILIIGSGGAGKSTMAVKLGDALGIPVLHLDALFWKPGWVMTPVDEERATLTEVMRGECWIMDGNYRSTLDQRIPEADTIIFLDLPRLTCVRRAIKRRIQYHGKTRPDMGPGNPERIDVSFLKWIWNYPRDARPRVLALLDEAKANGKQVIRLRSDAEVDALIATARVKTPMRNVLVIGSSGAGKSTFARQLADRLGIEAIHLDAAFWKPGWIESDYDDFRERISQLAVRDTWVMDGNYSKTLDLRLPYADTLIYLDVPRHVCLWRVSRRVVKHYGRSRVDLGEACPERFELAFLKWVWDYPKEREPKMLRMLDEQRSEKQVIVLCNSSEIEAFLAGVERTCD
jgi:adenylate kinase family enzyme